MVLTQLKWDLPHLHTHLQAAVALEFWTIGYYMSVLYSIKDPSSLPYQLIQSVVYQEMFHVELAANVANAYGLSPVFKSPVYEGDNIPHLDFKLDHPDPTKQYSPYTAELGPLDESHINAMCLIEYPEWQSAVKPDLRENISQYGSIGEFYDAIEFGASELVDRIQPNHNQVSFFKRFYKNFSDTTVTKIGGEGIIQVLDLLGAIVDQGAGKTSGDKEIEPEFQNTADDFYPGWSHYTKFITLRNSKNWPEVYSGIASPEPGSPGAQAQQILIRNFTEFRQELEKLFQGQPSPQFGATMATLGGNVLNCWKKGAIPKFS
ncbi:hypothetical protein Lepto7375DRAFT_1135 [Leptolyngbya sp. PCC 7375]|nr:hypothetical protein Lepto7375DRAFT_1135 [Leptolyngbya sp. PCC 7375]